MLFYACKNVKLKNFLFLSDISSMTFSYFKQRALQHENEIMSH